MLEASENRELALISYTTVAAILAVPLLGAIIVGVSLLKRAFFLPKRLPEEFVLACAWVFMVGSFLWLGVFLSASTLLGFSAPWSWLASAHFAFAGFGALTITALSCRIVTDLQMRKILRILLFAHPVAYLVTAAGICGIAYCNQLGASMYLLIFFTQVWAVIRGKPDRIARYPQLLLVFALAVPVITLIPALAWAWGMPILDLAGMVRYHGIVNAVCHVGLGLVAFSWGRPPIQDSMP